MTDDEEPAADENVAIRQLAIPNGVTFGLLLAAVLTVAFGWWHRNPNVPLFLDRPDVTSVLTRTTVVVALTAAVIVAVKVVGRWRRTTTPHARLLSYSAPAAAVLAIGGIVALSARENSRVWARAAEQQLGLDGISVTGVARIAWWCACLAVLSAAFVAMHGYVNPEIDSPQPPRKPWASAWLTTVVAVAVAAAGVTPALLAAPPVTSETAAAVAAPVLENVDGGLAYEVDADSTAEFVVAGAGFVQVARDETGDGHVVTGHDGATGEQRWSFTMPGLLVSELRSTGTGPDSVVVMEVTSPADAAVGLDATTGAPLWIKPDASRFVDGEPSPPVSSSIVLLRRDRDTSTVDASAATEWVAVSATTGEELWSKTFEFDCVPQARIGNDVVRVIGCEGVVVQVLDVQTGA